MKAFDYEYYHETKPHVNPRFPYNTYLCTIPLDFTNISTHWHDELELIIIKKGQGRTDVDLISHEVQAGDIILVLPGQLHSISQLCDQHMEYENILFDTRLLYSQHPDICTPEYLRPFFERRYFVPSHIHSGYPYYPGLYGCIKELDDICSRQEPYYELFIKSILYRFFFLLFSAQPRQEVSYAGEQNIQRMKKVLTFVEENYMHSVSLSDAAGFLNFSPSHFMRFFKQNMDMTFTEYLNDYRLSISAKYLSETEESILWVAEQCGFSNLSYFNRLFKRKFNMTPREYRSAR